MLRTKLSEDIRTESTGDLYTKKPVLSKDLEYLSSSGWLPLGALREDEVKSVWQDA